MGDEKVPSGGASPCAADGQTTGPGKRAVVSHVQTSSRDRSAPLVPRGNRATPPPVNDRVGGVIKNLEDHIMPRSTKKTPMTLSESPILSPDTAQALEKAEKLVKDARKQLIEASYDISSSPEREQSVGSARGKNTDDEDALYIRDIVSTRFREANESARIFTRPSTRPLAERLCRPEVRKRRARRHVGEGINKICSEESTNRRCNPRKNIDRRVSERNSKFAAKTGNSFNPRRVIRGDEILNEIPMAKPSVLAVERSPCKISHPIGVNNSFKVQEGPRVDIRNELTVTSVENVDICPQPRSSLPVQQNIKTYEFRHESCLKEIASINASRNCQVAPRSINPAIATTSPARASPEVTEKSRDPLRKSPGAVSASPRQGSWSDLVANKSGRSIQPEPLEGHNATTKVSKRGEHVTEENKENRGESFIDFLKRSADTNAPTISKDNKNANVLKDRVFGSLNTKDKINIFDRVIDEFFDEFKRAEREIPVKISPGDSPEEEKSNGQLPGRDVVDRFFFKDRLYDGKTDNNLIDKSFVNDSATSLADNWDPEDIDLDPPNLGELEKTVRKLDGTIDKVLRGTRSLGVLMGRYSIEAEVPKLPKPQRMNHEEPRTQIPASFDCVPTKDTFSGNQQQTNIDRVREKHVLTIHEDDSGKNQINRTKDSISSSEDSNKEVAAFPRCKVAQGLKIITETEKHLAGMQLANSHPRFSTPMNNNGAKKGNLYHSNAEFKSNEFARFLSGIQRPLENKREEDEPDVSAAERRNELLPALDIERQKKIVLDEIDRNCNFDSLFNRDRHSNSIDNDDEKTHDSVTFPAYTTGKKRESSDLRDSAMKSMIHDSAIGRATDQSEKISVGTNLIDERVTRKDSSRSEQSAPVNKNDETSKKENLSTKTLTVKKNSNEAVQVVTIGVEDEKTLTEHDDEMKKELSPQADGTSDKNRHVVSAGSSLKDRTSFDVSTAYSDDFEEPLLSTEKSKPQDKHEASRNVELKSISDAKELSATVETIHKYAKEDKTLPSCQKSSESSKPRSESKKATEYLEKSVSFSVNKLSDKDEENLADPTLKGKTGTVESNSEIKEADPDPREVSEKSSKDRASVASSASASSSKASRTSSLVGESHRERFKKLEESNVVLNETIQDFQKREDKEQLKPQELLKICQINSHTDVECCNKSGLSSVEHPSSNMMQKSNLESCTNFEKIADLESSAMIHSTPKQLISNARRAADVVVSPFSDPIPDDDRIEGAADTCSENYSEGELYLPSSCSYSLGEIRISERPSCETVGAGIESSTRNADGMRIFFTKSYTTFNSSDNTINAPNTPAQSPGEVQETDVESICGSRGLSSDEEQQQHKRANQFAIQS